MDYRGFVDAAKVLEDLIERGVEPDKLSFVLEVYKPIAENEVKKQERKELRLRESYFNKPPDAHMNHCMLAFNAMIREYEEAYEDVGRMDNRTQDILHELELLDLPDEEVARLGEELRAVRRNRRFAKNYVTAAQPMYDYIKANPHVHQDIIRVNGDVQRISRGFANRKYLPREKTSMAHAFEVAASKA